MNGSGNHTGTQMSLKRSKADERAREIERKVSPIYSAIDAGNLKQALKICEKPGLAQFPITQALKAHCLQRAGRAAEALQLCRDVQRAAEIAAGLDIEHWAISLSHAKTHAIASVIASSS